MLGEESKDSNLCQSSVVQFRDKSLLFLLGTGVLAQSKGVEKVERHWVGDKVLFVEGRESSWLSSTHVVCSGRFREKFQESNEKDDLPFGGFGHGIPLFRRGKAITDCDSSSNTGPWEADSVGLNTVSDEGGHSDTSVLDLRVTQETNGGFVGVSPHGSGGQLKRIVVLRVERKRDWREKIIMFVEDKSIPNNENILI